MPTAYVSNVASSLGISDEKAEKMWDEAKTIALKSKSESDKEFWPYVTSIFKKISGVSTKVNESLEIYYKLQD